MPDLLLNAFNGARRWLRVILALSKSSTGQSEESNEPYLVFIFFILRLKYFLENKKFLGSLSLRAEPLTGKITGSQPNAVQPLLNIK
jgi:hypothetical protein